MGGTLASEAAHRLAAGAETLSLRMDNVCSNALTLALALDAHPKVDKVHYPGLSNHDQHERAAQLFGHRFGGLLGIDLIDEVDVFAFLNRLKVLDLATLLGDNVIG